MPDGEMPSMKSIGDAASKQFKLPSIKDPLSFVQPAKDVADVLNKVDEVKGKVEDALDKF